MDNKNGDKSSKKRRGKKRESAMLLMGWIAIDGDGALYMYHDKPTYSKATKSWDTPDEDGWIVGIEDTPIGDRLEHLKPRSRPIPATMFIKLWEGGTHGIPGRIDHRSLRGRGRNIAGDNLGMEGMVKWPTT